MLRKVLTAVPFLTLLLLLSHGPLHSTIMVKIPLEEMVRKAEYIFLGKVTEITMVRGEESGDIYTLATITVEESIKGGPFTLGKLTLKVRGGSLPAENIALRIPGSPTFEKGEEVFIFARKRKDGTYTTVGLGQGKMEVYYDEKRGARVVTSESEDVYYIEKDSETGEWKSLKSPTGEVYPLQEFMEKVRDLME